MAQDKKVEQITSMEDDFAQWYTDIVKKAELSDYSSVKGCMIIKPAAESFCLWFFRCGSFSSGSCFFHKVTPP